MADEQWRGVEEFGRFAIASIGGKCPGTAG